MCVKLLDCTLRDGGYIIDWMFGKKNIQSVLCNLSDAGIDYIECGFLKDCEQYDDKTFFSSPDLVQKNLNCTLMINYGEYPIEKFTQCENKNTKIRVAFKKSKQKEALEYIHKLVSLGWDVFANPMSTNTYSETELELLINDINKIKPYGLTIVVTLGNMYQDDVREIFEFIDKRLEKGIALGFHSHNSLQLSFSNAKTLLKMNLEREIVLDCCLNGMGRGAGNLCTELILPYLNENFGADYKILPILKILDECINPIYEKNPWGYSTAYCVAAVHGCHPNYATYLKARNVSDLEIGRILSKIPADKKTVFDKEVICTFSSLYLRGKEKKKYQKEEKARD